MIDSNAKLQEYLPTLLASPWVGIDTEADSLHAYPEKLCLLQIGTCAGEVLVDPLNEVDLRPLFVLRYVCWHNLALVILMGLVVLLQADVFPFNLLVVR